MANDPDLLVRYARLKRGERNALFEVAAKHSPAVSFDRVAFEAHLAQVVDDRLAFAERLLAFAAREIVSAAGGADPDMGFRMALARSYYAVHHALRALHVAFEGWDPDGHKETVEATIKLLQNHPAVASRSSGWGRGSRFRRRRRTSWTSVTSRTTTSTTATWSVRRRWISPSGRHKRILWRRISS